MIFNQSAFKSLFIVGIVGYCIAGAVSIIKKDKIFEIATIIAIGIYSSMTTYIVVDAYSQSHYMDWTHGNDGNERYYERLKAYANLDNPNESYRFSGLDNSMFMIGNITGNASFTSTVNGSIIELHNQITEDRKVFTPYKNTGLNELLSAKYYVATTPSSNSDALVTTVQYADVEESIYERNNILPIGYTYDTYITSKESENYTNEEKLMLMLQTLIIDKDDEPTVSQSLNHFNLSDANLDWTSLLNDWITYHKACSSEFKRTKNGFTASINSPLDSYAFFSVPNDRGFKAYVNGAEAKIININGLMAVKISAGDNYIQFINTNWYLRIGLIISIFSIITWCIYVFKGKRG